MFYLLWQRRLATLPLRHTSSWPGLRRPSHNRLSNAGWHRRLPIWERHWRIFANNQDGCSAAWRGTVCRIRSNYKNKLHLKLLLPRGLATPGWSVAAVCQRVSVIARKHFIVTSTFLHYDLLFCLCTGTYVLGANAWVTDTCNPIQDYIY